MRSCSYPLTILCIDLRCPLNQYELYEDIISKQKEGLKFFANMKGILTEPSKTFLVAFVALKNKPVTVAQAFRFDLFKVHQIITHELVPCHVSDLTGDILVDLLEHVVRYVVGLKDQIQESNFNDHSVAPIKIICMSSLCLPSNNRSKALLEQMNRDKITMDYLYVILPLLGLSNDSDIVINSALADFAILMREFENFRLLRVHNDTMAWENYFKNLIGSMLYPPNSPIYLHFPTPPDLIIHCSLQAHIIDKLNITSSSICACHGYVINQIHHETNFCSISYQPLTTQDLIQPAFCIGDTSIVTREKQPLPNNNPIELVVLQKVALSSVSESLLYGHSHVLSFDILEEMDWESFNNNKFCFGAVCLSLDEKDQGLLVKAEKKDLQGKIIYPGMIKYYLLMPTKDGSHFLVKSIAVGEEVVPLPTTYAMTWNDLPKESVDLVQQNLVKVPLSPSFDPMDLHTNYNTQVNDLLQHGTNVTTTKHKKSPGNLPKSPGNLPKSPGNLPKSPENLSFSRVSPSKIISKSHASFKSSPPPPSIPVPLVPTSLPLQKKAHDNSDKNTTTKKNYSLKRIETISLPGME